MQTPIAFLLMGVLLIGGVAHTSANNDIKTGQSDAAAFSLLHEGRTTTTPATTSNSETSLLGANSAKSYLAKTSKPATSKIVDYSLPTVETIAARNIEVNSAEFRGEVNMHSYTKGVAFIVYGYNQTKVNNLTNQYKTFASIPKLETDAVKIYKLDANANAVKTYSRRISGLIQNADYFYKLCIDYTNLAGKSVIKCGALENFSTNPKDPRSNKFASARVSTYAATFVNAYDATISGSVTMNDAEEGIVFFVYGEDQDYINGVDTYFKKYSAVKEDKEDLQKIRVSVGTKGKAKFTQLIEDLDKGTQYFYRMCVEFDGNEAGLICSNTKNFTTDARDLGNIPSVLTNGNIAYSTEAKLFGSASMLDYHDGVAFFVYGTDEAKIKALGGLGSFNRISQSIDKIQRVSVDNDFDGKDSFSLQVKDLKTNSKYFYRLCVEYKTEDEKNREQLYLACGLTKTFRTGF